MLLVLDMVIVPATLAMYPGAAASSNICRSVSMMSMPQLKEMSLNWVSKGKHEKCRGATEKCIPTGNHVRLMEDPVREARNLLRGSAIR